MPFHDKNLNKHRYKKEHSKKKTKKGGRERKRRGRKEGGRKNPTLYLAVDDNFLSLR